MNTYNPTNNLFNWTPVKPTPTLVLVNGRLVPAGK